jgi:hypothetical protein
VPAIESEVPVAMRKVYRQLERWRRRHTGRAGIPASLFVRIHRSAIVNIDLVQELRHDTHGDYIAVLRDRTEVRGGVFGRGCGFFSDLLRSLGIPESMGNLHEPKWGRMPSCRDGPAAHKK